MSDFERRILQPDSVYAPSNAYSPGVSVKVPGATFIFVTGQIAKDQDGKVVAPGDAAAQAEFIFEKIGKILA